MSCYEDIYNDFPLRCARLWEGMRDSPVAKELDVTFMLMAAAAGFATPWEQLKIQPGSAAQHSGGHPAFHRHDQKAYEKSLAVIVKVLDQRLHSSDLFRDAKLTDWSCGLVKSIDQILDAVEMHSFQKTDMGEARTRDIVKILRNAIAHNNIYAFSRKSREGGGQDQRISELAFFSEKVEFSEDVKIVQGFDVVAMPVGDFQGFLNGWFSLLKRAQPRGKQLRLVVTHALAEAHERVAA